jgi:hypothetical protein
MSLTAPERETVINFSDHEDVAYIYSAQRTVITKLKANPAAVLVEEGVFEGSAWARFTLPASLVSFRTTRIKRELSDGQREALAARMRDMRAKKGAGPC